MGELPKMTVAELAGKTPDTQFRWALEMLWPLWEPRTVLTAEQLIALSILNGLASKYLDARGGLECGWCHELMPAHAPGCEGADHG